MYKKILVSLFVLSFGSVLTINAADDPSRLRIYYPLSTTAAVEGCATCTVAGEGFSLHYVFGFGLGLGVTNSKTNITGGSSDYSIDAGSMIDVSYSFGSDFTFTLGYGVGSSPNYEQEAVENVVTVVTGGSSNNSLIGIGYNFGGIEVLLGMRNVSATIQYENTITIPGLGSITQAGVSTNNWLTTDIGVGFTF